MDQARRAAARELREAGVAQHVFRSNPAYADALREVCSRLFVTIDHVYLLGSIPEQLEDCVSVFVWPSTVMTFEITRANGQAGQFEAVHIQEYLRGRRGTDRRHCEMVMKVAERDWGAQRP